MSKMGLGRVGICVTLCVLITATFSQELEIKKSTDDEVSIGDDVTIRCRVKDFPPGAAVSWWKRQGDEEARLGVNNNLDAENGRYSLNVDQTANTIIFYLNIRGVHLEDNGEIGCALVDSESVKIYTNLVVTDPVKSIRLFAMPSTDVNAEPLHEYKDGEEFLFHDGQPYFYKCVASGSNPIPQVDITIGYKDEVSSLKDYFNVESHLISDPLAGDVAFRQFTYESVMATSKAIVVGWKANSQELRCSAAVPNMESPISVHIKPILKIPPVIECESSRKVAIWSGRTTVSCNVFADPPAQEIRWYWGDEHRAISLVPGEYYGLYSFILSDGEKPDMKVATLVMDKTFIEMYKMYNLVAKNQKGLTVHTFTLLRDPAHEKNLPQTNGALRHGLSISVLSSVILISSMLTQ